MAKLIEPRDLRAVNTDYQIRMWKERPTGHARDWHWEVYDPSGRMIANGKPFCGFGRISAYMLARSHIRHDKQAKKVYRVR